MDEKGLGLHLQEARQRAGLTQQDLCQKAGLSYSTLAKIERGAIKSPSIFTISQLASALGMSLDKLVGFTGTDQVTAETPKKRSKTGITFVYFDVNGCLVRFFHRAFGRIAEDSGVSPDVIETTFWHYNDAVCRGEMTMEDYNAALGKRFKLPKFDWAEYYLAVIEPITEMHEVVEWAAKHYRIGLLTNIVPGLLDALLERALLPPGPYTAIVDSSIVHTIKPENEIYEVAEKKSGVDASEILLVDNTRANIMAAEQRSWRVLWFDDYRPAESATRVRTALEPEA